MWPAIVYRGLGQYGTVEQVLTVPRAEAAALFKALESIHTSVPWSGPKEHHIYIDAKIIYDAYMVRQRGGSPM